MFFLFGLGGVLIFSVTSLCVFLVLLHKPLYISPIPNISKSIGASIKEKNLPFFERELQEKHIDFSSVEVSGSSYLIHMKNEQVVILSTQKEIKTQISSLQFILSRLTMEGKLFSRLDLRFDKPVITIRQ